MTCQRNLFRFLSGLDSKRSDSAFHPLAMGALLLTLLGSAFLPSPIAAQASAGNTPSAASAAKTNTAPPAEQKPLTVPLDVTIPIAPTAFRAGGKMNLAYELHIVNMGNKDCTLVQIDTVPSTPSAQPLASFSGSTLESMISHPGQTVTDKAKLAPGTEAVVFMWVTADNPDDIPSAIRHRISARVGAYPETLMLETAPIEVRTGPVVISPPLTGDHWLAANGPSNTSAHRRALIPLNGRAVISQRFAIDWVKLGEGGKTYQGDPLDNKNYYAFGSNALAVADGIVTEVKDGIPLNVPGINSRAVPITLETVGGNHVIIDIGNGNYAFYAHLQPHSIRVKLGDKVHRGQVIGLVGNTGNSTEPHLHFHISNASSPLASEGLPYSLRSFEVEGKAVNFSWDPATAKGTPTKYEMQIPLENDVVRFPDSQ